ncbi:PHD finger protein rhinocero [Zea mays]|uniref:PHD finger protein rhinocero n=1 Tax=Zea mays TaxID=4577 RepID=A0A3L6EN86_MAIZE|nr:PHD finger protein rhinocero [Zea mays]
MSGEMARAEALPEGEAPGFGVDLYAQATKAVSLRTPFEGDEAAPRVPTLPARLVSWAGPGDARKKHKKILPPPPDDAAPEPPPQSPVVTPAKVGLWDQFEAYFRPVTLADVEMLRPKLPFGYSKVDSCMLVPFLGSGNESTTQAETYDVAVAETTLYLGVGGEEVVTNRERGVQSVHLASQKERNDQSIEHDIHDVVVQQMVSDKELNRHRGVQGIHEVSIQLGGRSSGVDQAGSSSGIVLGQFVNEEGTSLNWLLGATGRFVLTSERPNKKRKLLGVDAGLEQLVLLPRVGAEASASCDVCCLGESSMESNRIVNCSNCKVSVHQKCYGLHAVPDGQWLCAWCTYLESTGWSLKEDAGNTQSMPCALCPKEKGALKPVKVESTRNEGIGHQKFVHLYCSLWAPEVFVEDMESMEPVLSLENVQENRMKLTCSICKIKHGACVRCSHGTCRTPFHPICARESKHQMEIWGKSRHPNVRPSILMVAISLTEVELRAFCSKHSAVEYASSVDTSNLASEQNPRKSGPYNTTLNSGKIPVIRFTRKNKDKFISCGTSASSSGNLIRVKTIEQDALANTVRNANSQPIRIWETGTGHPSVSGDHIRSSGDIAVVLRKLIDSGKVSVSDVASEVGISSESLEAALVGETTTFSHGLTLKIIKWLQNSVHMHGAQGNVCKGSSGVVQDNKSDGLDTTDTVDVKNALVLDDDKGVLVDVPDFAVTEPARTRSKSNSKILKENNATCATGVTIVQNGEKNMVKEDSNPECAAKEFANESTQGFSPSSSKDVLKDEHGILILNDTSGNKESGTSTQIPNEKQGALLGRKNNDLTEVELGPCLEKGVPSHGHCFVQGDNGVDGVGSVENSFNTSNCSHGQPFFNFDDSHSYIHPFIKKKVSHHWDITFNQNKETLNHYIQESSYPSHEKIPTDSLVEVESTADTTVTDQVLKARSSKILEHSPDDEVEGEMVYLQSRLLDNAVVLKHRYEKLIAKVVQNLCRELDAFSKRKWDLIFVNQFLRDVREAKKRGRKEKRHKEAQAVLAAAAAAIASSSRNSTVRKDAKENAPEAAVHIDCYRNLENSIGPWNCELCEDEDISSEATSTTVSDKSHCNGKLPFAQCGMCHGTSGAFRKTVDGKWVHAFCAEWLLDTKYVRGQDSPVEGMCSSGDCNITFHPTCARSSGLYMNTKGFGTTSQHKAYCDKHSVEQKEADAQQYGPEELRSMKRMRGWQWGGDGRSHSSATILELAAPPWPQNVELEKLRLLCERIIKREKVKRETVMCDHDILAKTKDTVIFSYLACGASSESATTSVNNRSYMQRSDDVTVDSTISGKKTIRFSLKNRDVDRNTADSSRTLISFKRKLSERGPRAGKQLPQRPTIAAEKLEDEDKKTTDKKIIMQQREMFQKELVMTLDQASTQNQRLPKGYAYVPRDSLSKEKLWNRNTQPLNPQEPGG